MQGPWLFAGHYNERRDDDGVSPLKLCPDLVKAGPREDHSNLDFTRQTGFCLVTSVVRLRVMALVGFCVMGERMRMDEVRSVFADDHKMPGFPEVGLQILCRKPGRRVEHRKAEGILISDGKPAPVQLYPYSRCLD